MGTAIKSPSHSRGKADRALNVWIAGMMPIAKLPSEETVPTEGRITPAKSFLHFLIRCAIVKLPSEFERGTSSRQIDRPEPNSIIGRAFASGDDPESGQRVQDAAVQNAQQAVSSKAGTFADENDPQSLGQIEPLASEHGTRGARFLPRSLRRDKKAVGLVLTTREGLLLFGLL